MPAPQVEKIVEIYRALAKFPSPTSARILNKNNQSQFSVVSSWTQRNLEYGKMTKFQVFHHVDVCTKKSSSALPTDSSNVLSFSVSPTEENSAVLRELPDNSNSTKKQQFLEVWEKTHLLKNYDLGALDVHGDVYSDAELGSFEWSPCEEKLLYVAEKKYPKSEPFYKPKSQEKKNNGNEDSKVTKGNEYLFRQDWGEQLLGKCESVIGICNLKTDIISILDGIPENFVPGQVIWTPDGNGVVGVVWNVVPRKLGLIFCTNRESYIFHLTVNGDFSLLSAKGKAVRSPRFSPNGEKLVWLERDAGGPHHSAHRLMCLSWATKESRIVVDTVSKEIQIQGGESFYGLFNLSLPKRCWTANSNGIVLSTPQKYAVNSFLVNLDTNSVTALKIDEGSLTALDVWNDVVICSNSSFNKPPVLLLGKLQNILKNIDKEESASVNWFQISESRPNFILKEIAYHYLTIVDKEEQNTSCNTFSAMYIGPNTSPRPGDLPLIVLPHGGPHSSNCNMFLMNIALFNLLGFGVLLINYRGSIGAGQDNVNFLLGNIGVTDVKDVRLATKEVLEKFPVHSADKVLLYGGSHGGFLVTHLSGQFPTDYKAVVAINPVIDVAAMFYISDIPDWSCVEANVPYNITGNIPIEAFEKMKKCSPLNFCSPSSPPTLLLIGKKDARVPGSQGMDFYYSLKANHVKTKLLLYDDNHSLSQVPVEMDELINAILWFFEHL
ncbi:hypothetical protein R5R35_011489 [Gryllus longicercus]|uniref:acylaminoacyl-peptidase n=1 Tax=Gryllus longicercus TaxID=2509291 RepID=A0AAN9VC24_9ORTH